MMTATIQSSGKLDTRNLAIGLTEAIFAMESIRITGPHKAAEIPMSEGNRKERRRAAAENRFYSRKRRSSR